MDVALDMLIKLYRFSTRRRLFALSKVGEVAARMELGALAARIDRALAHDRRTHELDLRWAGRKRLDRTAANLQEIDTLADQVVTSLRDGAMALTRGARAGEPIHEEVAAFLRALMPEGVYAITSLPHVEQLIALEAMVDRLQGPLAAAALDLGLERQAARLARLTREYRAAVESNSRASKLRFAEVSAARDQGQAHLLEIVAVILGSFPGSDDPAHIEARGALLDPIMEQNETIRTYQRARRGRPKGAPEAGAAAGEGPEEPVPELE